MEGILDASPRRRAVRRVWSGPLAIPRGGGHRKPVDGAGPVAHGLRWPRHRRHGPGRGDRRRRVAVQPGVRAGPSSGLRWGRRCARPTRCLDPDPGRRGRGHRRGCHRPVHAAGAARCAPARHRRRHRARRPAERPQRRRRDQWRGRRDRVRDAARCRYAVGHDRRPPGVICRDPSPLADGVRPGARRGRRRGRDLVDVPRPARGRSSSRSRWSSAASAGSCSWSRRSSRWGSRASSPTSSSGRRRRTRSRCRPSTGTRPCSSISRLPSWRGSPRSPTSPSSAVKPLWARVPLPPMGRMVVAGALVGLVAIWLPEVMGTGTATMKDLFGGATIPLATLLVLAVAETILTPASLGAGFVGGVIGPSMLIGSTLGSAVGTIVIRSSRTSGCHRSCSPWSGRRRCSPGASMPRSSGP